MTMKKIKLNIDPLGILSDFIGEDVTIELPVADYLVPLFKFQEEGEEKTESNEEEQVLSLLKAADRELERGNIEVVHTHLDQALKLSRCSRCVRNMESIKLKIKEGDLSEARRRLDILISLVPSYYQIIRTEGEIGTELDTTKTIEEECGTCNAAQIVEECNWDAKCLDYVIQFIDDKKKRGEKVYADELIQKAKEYQKTKEGIKV